MIRLASAWAKNSQRVAKEKHEFLKHFKFVFSFYFLQILKKKNHK